MPKPSKHFSRDVLPRILKHEGGKVDHPKDPGGRTNMGITQRTYDGWRRSNGLRPRDVFTISDWEVEEIYYANYWRPVKGDTLAIGVGYSTMDAAVNSGPSRAAKWLQKAIGLKGSSVDGAIGPATLQAAAAINDKVSLIQRACAIRMSFLRGLSHWKTFGKGWSRRVAEVEADAVQMALRNQGVDEAPILRNEAQKATDTAKKQTNGAKAAGSGGLVSTPTLLTDLPQELVIGVLVIAGLMVAFLIFKSRFQKHRAEAYRAVAAKSEKGNK